MLPMLPSPTLSLALMEALDHERTRVPSHRAQRLPKPRLRAARSRRAARAAAAAC
jgi:hypothetical protein